MYIIVTHNIMGWTNGKKYFGLTGTVVKYINSYTCTMEAPYTSRGVTPIGAVSRAATAVKIFDRPKMALTA